MGTQLPQLAEQLPLALQTLNSNTSREQKQQASSFLEGFQKSVLLLYFDCYFCTFWLMRTPSHQDRIVGCRTWCPSKKFNSWHRCENFRGTDFKVQGASLNH